MQRIVRRNTELGLILLGTLVTVGAYLLASLAEESQIPANIGPFLGVVLGLQLAAHIAIRKLAPEADGTLVPIAGLLNGLGYVFIVRLDEAKADPQGLAGLQAGWAAVGILAFVGTLLFVRRVRDLEAYRWTIGFGGIALLLLPLVPGVGRTINGAKIWVGIGPVSFQPGEFAKILLALFFASYLVEKRELLAVSRHRLGPIALPDLKHLGPVLLAWGVSLVVMVSEKDLGQLAAVLRPVRGPALGGHRAGVLPHRRGRAVRRRIAVRAGPVQPRAGPRRDLARPVAGPEGRRVPDRRVAVRVRGRRRRRAPGSDSAPPPASPTPRPTSSSPPSVRSSA